MVVSNPSYLKPATDEQAARFLLQAQFSANQAEIAALRAGSYAAYLQQQFDKPLGQTGWNWLNARGYNAVDANRYFFQTYPADFMVWNQLFTSNDALRKRCALALSEYFVVGLQALEFTWRSHAAAQYWDVLVKNAFGNFRQLLEDITLNPAMGYYLNTKGNLKEDAAKGRLPDENYAREVMQLFTIGLYQLDAFGVEKLDANGKKLETYTPSDVANLAKAFTGYDIDTSDGVKFTPPGATYQIQSTAFTQKPMVANPSKASSSGATFLGATIPAGATPAAALKIALDTLFNHRNLPAFFCKQMIQRLVTSNPSPSYVGRVSAKFVNNGAGVRGDLQAVWAAILQDDEARKPQGLTSTTFGKLREPMLRMVQWGRTFNLRSVAGSWKVFDLSSPNLALGQSPLHAPSVFNFFRPAYVPPNTAMALAKAPAPEFQLLNEVTVGGYLNYMQDVIRNGINCPNPTVPEASFNLYSRDILPDYTQEMALSSTPAALITRLNVLLCAGQLSAATQSLMVKALAANPITAASTDAQKRDCVAAAILMVMSSAEYLIQK